MTIKNWVILLFLTFTLIYATIGDRYNELWSACNYIATYSLLLAMFWDYPVKHIRNVGISLFISILIYILIQYVFKIEIERYYTFLTFSICMWGLYNLKKL